jgi:hypothetical protein
MVVVVSREASEDEIIPIENDSSEDLCVSFGQRFLVRIAGGR